MVIIASSEFTLKSTPVRKTLEQRLLDDIRVALVRAGIENLRPEKHAGRIIILGAKDVESVTLACSRIFGVAYAAHGLMVPLTMNDIIQAAVQTASDLRDDQSFAIRSRRSGPSLISRREIEIRAGSEILAKLKERQVHVDLDQPDMTIYVDLADDRAYVYSVKLPGPGGLPLSSQWKMLAVFDSGPLSVLAAYSMMRRGCMVELFIPTTNQTSPFDREHQFDLARRLRQFVTRTDYKAHVFEMNEIHDVSPERFGAGDLKRNLRSLAFAFAREKKFKGIVLSDVAGDLDKLRGEFEDPTVPPVRLYPLIGLEMEDLMQLSEEIGIPQEELRAASREMMQTESASGAPLRAYHTASVRTVLL